MTRDPRIDDKIAKAADFARPILEYFRALVHDTVEGVEETIKWGMPHFTYKGKNIAAMAPFKAHCAVTIAGVGRQGEGEGMGSYGKVASLADLPTDAELREKLLAGKARVDAGGSAARRAPIPRTSQKPVIPMPDDFTAALAKVPNARSQFEQLSPSARWDYLDWITSSKRDETRAKRIAEAVPWIAEGKRRNWKYER
jgi:uncharacterized protein YdeI (YjbR/CyaY-like superfamily)